MSGSSSGDDLAIDLEKQLLDQEESSNAFLEETPVKLKNTQHYQVQKPLLVKNIKLKKFQADCTDSVELSKTINTSSKMLTKFRNSNIQVMHIRTSYDKKSSILSSSQRKVIQNQKKRSLNNHSNQSDTIIENGDKRLEIHDAPSATRLKKFKFKNNNTNYVLKEGPMLAVSDVNNNVQNLESKVDSIGDDKSKNRGASRKAASRYDQEHNSFDMDD